MKRQSRLRGGKGSLTVRLSMIENAAYRLAVEYQEDAEARQRAEEHHNPPLRGN